MLCIELWSSRFPWVESVILYWLLSLLQVVGGGDPHWTNEIGGIFKTFIYCYFYAPFLKSSKWHWTEVEFLKKCSKLKAVKNCGWNWRWGWTFGRFCETRKLTVQRLKLKVLAEPLVKFVDVEIDWYFLKNRKYLYILWAIAFQLIYILNWNFKELCCHPWCPWWMFNINIWPNLGSYNFCTKLKILWLKLKM